MKHGNKAAPEKPAKAAPWSGSVVEPRGEPRDEAGLKDATAGELDELEDEFEDDRGLEAIRP